MNKKNDQSRITIDLQSDDHKKLKAVAAVLGISMRELVVESIKDRLCRINCVGIETVKVIKNQS